MSQHEGASRGRGRGRGRGRARGSSQEAKESKKTYSDKTLEMIDITRGLASLELFDSITHVGFHMMRKSWKEVEAEDYLRKQYFQTPPSDIISKSLYKKFRGGTWGRTTTHIAGHWIGILGTAPGTGSGSLTTVDAVKICVHGATVHLKLS
jgi:hypothetical protein